jgi:Uma2 family endonuclease
MVQLETPQITVSEDLFTALARENPELRLERRADGTLLAMPPTGSATGHRNSEILIQLGNWNRAQGDGLVFDSNAGFRLPNSAIYAPDAAWLSKSRWSKLTREQKEGFAPLCPEFVIELLSPSDSIADTRAKLEEYIENGTALGWIIDPFRFIVEIYRPNTEPEVLQNPSTIDGEGPVAGFALDLRPIFDALSSAD